MPDGEMRRPPQLWEQRLARTTSILGVGVSQGGATSIVPPTPPPTDGGPEPTPGQPPPETFKKPSTPSLIGGIQGITVLWDGRNSDNELYPYENSFVEVHMDTSGTAFTPGTATYQGRLARPGSLWVGGLTAGTTYHFRLRGIDFAGNTTEPSDAASGQTGLTQTSDYGTATIDSGAVSFDARAIGGITTTVGTSQPSSPTVGDIWLDSTGGAIVHKRWSGSTWVTQAWGSNSLSANSVTAVQVAAGAVTAGAIAAGAVTADKIQASAITSDKIAANAVTATQIAAGAIDGDTITGATVQTSASGGRIVFNETISGVASISFYNASGVRQMYMQPGIDRLAMFGNIGNNGYEITAGTVLPDTCRPEADVIVFQGYRTTTTAGDVIMRLKSDVTTTNQSKFEVEADGDVLSRTNSYAGFSDERFKENIEPARDYLEDLREVDVVNFNWIGDDYKMLGVIAQQIQPIFPSLVAEDEEGTLSVRYSVFVPMLITAVQSLANQVDDLRSRIEALEA